MTNVVQLPVKNPNLEQLETNSADVPEFISKADIDKMTDEQLDDMIAAIRTRRMNSFAIYKKTKEDKQHVTDAALRVKIDKKCEMVIKKLNMIDKNMDDLERYIAEIRGLRLQAGLEFM